MRGFWGLTLEFEVLLRSCKYVATLCMAASFTTPVHLNVSHLVLSGLVTKEQAGAQVVVIVWSESWSYHHFLKNQGTQDDDTFDQGDVTGECRIAWKL